MGNEFHQNISKNVKKCQKSQKIKNFEKNQKPLQYASKFFIPGLKYDVYVRFLAKIAKVFIGTFSLSDNLGEPKKYEKTHFWQF